VAPKLVNGFMHPHWFDECTLRQLKTEWQPRSGDVFLVSHFPLRGIQRLLVGLVEGRLDPWAANLIDKPHYCDAAACRRGVGAFIQEVASWPGRRCFKTHAFPQHFPCCYPFEPMYEGTPPKILAIVAEPRHAIITWWSILKNMRRLRPLDSDLLEDFILLISQKQFQMFGDLIDHAQSWANEAMANPRHVRLCSADRLGSVDAKEVKAELESIAEFLEIPKQSAAELAANLFRRPSDADEALILDDLVPYEALGGGPLIEQYGRNVHLFEDALNAATFEVRSSWRGALGDWLGSAYSKIAHLVEVSARGIASVPPHVLTVPLKGDAVHAAGACKPCVFNLRGICRDSAEMCLFCHAPGHARTKRASRCVRKARKMRARTPSPDALLVF